MIKQNRQLKKFLFLVTAAILNWDNILKGSVVSEKNLNVTTFLSDGKRSLNLCPGELK
jgi:hypothetical protein